MLELLADDRPLGTAIMRSLAIGRAIANAIYGPIFSLSGCHTRCPFDGFGFAILSFGIGAPQLMLDRCRRIGCLSR